MPLTPTNLAPRGGETIDPTKANTFAWVSDGTQAAYYIEYAVNGTTAAPSNTGWQVFSTSQHVFASGTFEYNIVYKWRVKIRNTAGQVSAFSDWEVFLAGQLTPLEIIFPAADYNTVTSLPIYKHKFSSPDHAAQWKFQYLVYTGLTWDGYDALSATLQDTLTSDELELYGGSLIWDSGEIIGDDVQIEQPPGYFTSGVYWYKVRVKVWDATGKLYTSDLRTFYIVLNSIPKTPTITAAADSANGRNIITITNPTPDAGQVAASYNKLYRKQPDGSWTLLQSDIISGTTYDATCTSGKNEEYAVSAVGTNGIESGKSSSAYAKCTLDAYWFTDPTTSLTIKLQANAQWGQMASERSREEYSGMDEVYPQVLYEAKRVYRGSFQATLEKPTSGTWATYMAAIRSVLDSGNTLTFRAMGGDVYKMDVYDLQFNPSADRRQNVREISFNMVEVAEAVPAGTYTYTAEPSTITNYWLIDPDTNTGFELVANPDFGSLTSERNRSEFFGYEETMPKIKYDSKKAYRGGFSGVLLQPDDDSEFLPDMVKKFRELVDAPFKKPLLFKTFSGDVFLVDTYNFSFELFAKNDRGRKVSFEFVEVGGVVVTAA